MNKSIFRQQVVDEQNVVMYGKVLLTQPFSFLMATLLVAIILFSVGSILYFGKYARKETVTGYLVPDKGLIKVYAPSQGLLSNVHFLGDQVVKKGDLLFTVSTVKSNDTEDGTNSLLLKQLDSQKLNLMDRIRQEELLQASILEGLAGEEAGAIEEMNQIQKLIYFQEVQIERSNKSLLRLNKLLNEGHATELEISNSENENVNLQAQLQSSLRQIIQVENRLGEIKLKRGNEPLKWNIKLSEFKDKLSKLEQNIVENEAKSRYTIHAPLSGRITALQVSQGQSIKPNTPLIAIVPEDTKLHAELFLPTRAIGFVEEKQKVFLKYDAFPFQHFGLHGGNISDVDHVILSSNELAVPVPINESVYRIKVELESQTVKAYSKQFPLQPGMLLEANIVLEERSLLQWLFQPIYGLRGKI